MLRYKPTSLGNKSLMHGIFRMITRRRIGCGQDDFSSRYTISINTRIAKRIGNHSPRKNTIACTPSTVVNKISISAGGTGGFYRPSFIIIPIGFNSFAIDTAAR